MIAARVLAPHTKLGTSRWWHTTTLAEEFAVTEADEDDLFAAMEWLLERQSTKKLAARHLRAACSSCRRGCGPSGERGTSG